MLREMILDAHLWNYLLGITLNWVALNLSFKLAIYPLSKLTAYRFAPIISLVHLHQIEASVKSSYRIDSTILFVISDALEEFWVAEGCFCKGVHGLILWQLVYGLIAVTQHHVKQVLIEEVHLLPFFLFLLQNPVLDLDVVKSFKLLLVVMEDVKKSLLKKFNHLEGLVYKSIEFAFLMPYYSSQNGIV